LPYAVPSRQIATNPANAKPKEKSAAPAASKDPRPKGTVSGRRGETPSAAKTKP
jgi:hypothetical protein